MEAENRDLEQVQDQVQEQKGEGTSEFVITEEMLEQADAYVPLAEKVAFAKISAEDCMEMVEMSVQKVLSDASLALPNQWQENITRKQLMLLRFFLVRYLHVAVSDEFPPKEYDRYASTFPLNQLERMKHSCAKYRNKIYDMISDYREVEKYLNAEIYIRKQVVNDGIERFLAGITVMSSPETIKQLADELTKTSEGLIKAKQELKGSDKKEDVK